MVKKLPAKQEIQVPSLGREDPLEKRMATHSSILGESPGQRSLESSPQSVTDPGVAESVMKE